jgi:hypothetical protein
MLEYKTQIIKLKNGEDLIANVSLNDSHYTLEEPMEFMLDDSRGRDVGLVMRHWLPVQLLKRNSIEIKVQDVLSIMEPADDFCEYYVNTVSKIKELLKAKNLIDEMDDDEMQQMINEFEELQHHGNTLH